MAGKRLRPKLFPDFIGRITQASPLDALEELIWNAFDERATRVEVRFTKNDLDGIDEITVSDDGLSLPYERAAEKFESLGNSDKAHRQLETGAKLHGRLGQGRHKALALGAMCSWTFTYTKAGGRLYTYEVEGTAGRSDPFFLNEEAPASDKQRGCVVRITKISKSLNALLSRDARRSLVAKFAQFLIGHPDRQLIFDGSAINPKDAIRSRKQLRPIVVAFEGREVRIAVEVIHWNELNRHREVFLCGESGVPLQQMGDLFLGAACDGSVFATSPVFDQLHNENLLQTAESSTEKGRSELVKALRTHVRSYFARLRRKAGQKVIEGLKDEGSYPYRRPAKSDIDRIERQVFDLCALNIHRHLPTFRDGMDPSARKLMLRMVQEALAQSPSSVGKIIREVLKLPADDAKKFASLLEDVPLTRVVNASHLIARRLDFLNFFRAITMLEPFDRTIRERTELHRILVDNTWIFGEEYHLGTSDQGLRKVLEKHIAILGRDELDQSADAKLLATLMRQWNESRVGTNLSLDRIPDVMLYKRFTDRRADEYEFLVVEIKRPGVAIGNQEVQQLRSYAKAIVSTPWADQQRSKWVFIIISDGVSEDVEDLMFQAQLPPYTIFRHADGRYELQVIPWSVILQSAQGRHEHLREWLNHSVPLETALERTSTIYREFLPEKKRKRKVGTSTNGKTHSRQPMTSTNADAVSEEENPKSS